MTRNDRAIAAVSAVLRGHRWPDAVSLERSRNVVAAWSGFTAIGDEYTEAHAAQQIRAAREPIYGGVRVSDDELHSLAARVVLALSLAEDAA